MFLTDPFRTMYNRAREVRAAQNSISSELPLDDFGK